MANRTIITIYTRQKTIARRLEAFPVRPCPLCRQEVAAVTVEAAAGLLQIDMGELSRLVDGSVLHKLATTLGASLICCPSLSLASA